MADKETTAFERTMFKKNNSVLHIKNISDERFEHPYGGEAYSIEAGETLPFVYPVGEHLAKHLAMKLAREAAKAKGKLEGNDDKKAVNLYTGTALEPYLSKIIVKTVEQELPAERTEAQVLREKTAKAQAEFKKAGGSAPKKPEVSKADIIKELRKRNIKFDPRAEKEELSALLIADEAKQ